MIAEPFYSLQSQLTLILWGKSNENLLYINDFNDNYLFEFASIFLLHITFYDLGATMKLYALFVTSITVFWLSILYSFMTNLPLR